jgi:cytosine permease
MKQQKQSRDFEQQSIPAEHRRGFWSMFVIMMGFTFFSASMFTGGAMGVGLNLKNFIIALILGNLFLGAYTGLLAYAASRTQLSIHLLSHYAFGTKGSYLPSAVLAVTQIGWFGVGVAMFALPTTAAIRPLLSPESWFAQGDNLLWTIVIIAGILMTSSAYWGIKALRIVSIVAVPAIAVLGFYSAVQALFFDHPAHIGAAVNGWQYLSMHQPAPGQELTMVTAISMAIGSFISGGTCTPDFARYSKSTRIGVSTTVLAFFIGNSIMIAFGAIGAMVWDKADISEVLMLQGLLFAGILVLGLNIWTTNDNALYTSGLGLANITKLPKRYLVLVNGLVGTLAAIWLNNNFVGWLNILNTFIPPVGAILIVDYLVCHHGKYLPLSEQKFVNINWAAVIAWACGTAIALIGADKIPGVHVGFLSQSLPAVNGMVVAIVVYLLLRKPLLKAA